LKFPGGVLRKSLLNMNYNQREAIKMESGSFLDLVRKRRNIRGFRPDPVPDEYVEQIIEAARWAQSGANAQPWEFVVVKNPETRARIADLWIELQSKGSHAIEESRVAELRHPSLSRSTPSPARFRDAPVVIVVCGDPRTYQATVLAEHFLSSGEGVTFYMNLANATQIMHLAAAALGLGAQWVSILRPLERGLKDLLGIPEIFRLYTMVPVGYPAYEPPPSYRREASELIHREKYDQAKYRSDEDIREYLMNLRKRTAAAYHVPI
jgi:nitroreductase